MTSLSLTVKKTDLCEKIYREYLMGLYNDGNATLVDIVNHYSDMYGLTLSAEDVMTHSVASSSAMVRTESCMTPPTNSQPSIPHLRVNETPQ